MWHSQNDNYSDEGQSNGWQWLGLGEEVNIKGEVWGTLEEKCNFCTWLWWWLHKFIHVVDFIELYTKKNRFLQMISFLKVRQSEELLFEPLVQKATFWFTGVLEIHLMMKTIHCPLVYFLFVLITEPHDLAGHPAAKLHIRFSRLP